MKKANTIKSTQGSSDSFIPSSKTNLSSLNPFKPLTLEVSEYCSYFRLKQKLNWKKFSVSVIVIPRNCNNDIHICGRCKVQYSMLNLFLEHKASCNAKLAQLSEVKTELNQEFNKRVEVDNLIEINELDTLVDAEKDCNQLVMLNSLLHKDPLQLKQFKIDIVEGNEICISQSDICLNNGHSNLMEQKLASPNDYKRTLQNDEEDIATLLANQLNSETSPDDLNVEGGVEMQADDPIDEIDHPKENEENEENKIMYRGKMRKLFTCQVGNCSYKTLLRKDIERHTRVHTGERPFKCFICNKAFTRTDKLLLHQRIHAGDKRYKCTKCDYASVDSGSLIKHLRVHNDERPFKCQLCSYRARDSSQLTVHLRTHTGDSPFVCTNDNCKAAFKTSSDLKRHMIIHSGEKPHSCLYCPYKCTLKRNLQIHVQSQHPNGEFKEYRCHLCPRYTFPTIRRLKNHMKKHHNELEKVAEENGEKPCAITNSENVMEKQSAYRKKRRKSRRSSDKVAVGVMNKAYDCKLCEASFVCQDSLLTHQRYHSKVEEEIRKSEYKRDNAEFSNQNIKKGKFKKIGSDEEGQKRVEHFSDNLVLNEGYIIENGTFNDSLRNAEILASINPIQGNENMRQYVMLAPEIVQNAFSGDEYVLPSN